jgi:hypothetical protein
VWLVLDEVDVVFPDSDFLNVEDGLTLEVGPLVGVITDF